MTGVHSTSKLINLDIYSTPWLQTLDAIYCEYGKDGLAQASKSSIELFIIDYIKKHELDIEDSDVPFLAKIMLPAEQ
ncbi:MAG: hypothetical protein WCN27_00210 [Alphaproteobacteria bacterium]